MSNLPNSETVPADLKASFGEGGDAAARGTREQREAPACPARGRTPDARDTHYGGEVPALLHVADPRSVRLTVVRVRHSRRDTHTREARQGSRGGTRESRGVTTRPSACYRVVHGWQGRRHWWTFRFATRPWQARRNRGGAI